MNTIKKQILNISKYLSIIVFFFAVINVTGEDIFSEWDTDSNGEISESEFQESFSAEHFSTWDVNNDENLTEEEYYQATFMILDKDKDQQLNTSESDWGYEHLYGDYVDYNTNVEEGQDDSGQDSTNVTIGQNSASANMNYDQYRESVRNTDFYSNNDSNADSNVTREELANSLFDNLDEDGNGSLSSSEFDQFSRYNVNSMNGSQE